jgi:hypothetical protein
MSPKEHGVTTFTERLRQNYTVPEPASHSTRIWSDRSVRLKLGAGITLCFACVAGLATVAFIHPVAEDVAASNTAPAMNIPAKLPEHASLTGWRPPDPGMASTAEEPVAVPDKATVTTMTAPVEPTLGEALIIKAPALPSSVTALHPAAEPAIPTEAVEPAVNAAIPLAAPTEVASTVTAVSPMGMQALRSTPSTPDPPPVQLRLPATEIAALLTRGDALFARGDISSARLFYERAADAGEGRAALRLGHIYDPVFLDFAHLRAQGDATLAESWYRRARELGETEAEILLTAAHRHRQDELTAAQHKIAPRERRVAIEEFDDVMAKKAASAGASEYAPNPRSTTQAQPEWQR